MTGTDSLSWKNKSWVVGIKLNGQAKAYDWNQLKKEKMIRDTIGKTAVLIVLAADGKSFFAYEVPPVNSIIMQRDTLFLNNIRYLLDGSGIDTTIALKRVMASQEFWHSWKTFYPDTRY